MRKFAAAHGAHAHTPTARVENPPSGEAPSLSGEASRRGLEPSWRGLTPALKDGSPVRAFGRCLRSLLPYLTEVSEAAEMVKRGRHNKEARGKVVDSSGTGLGQRPKT